MPHSATLDNPTQIILVDEVRTSAVSQVRYTRWKESVDDNGDYHISVFLLDYQKVIYDLMAGNQTGLKAIMDGSDTAVNKKDAVVRAAIQTGDYQKQ